MLRDKYVVFSSLFCLLGPNKSFKKVYSRTASLVSNNSEKSK